MRQRPDETWRFETRAKTRHASVETETRQRHENMSRDVSRQDTCLETLNLSNFLNKVSATAANRHMQRALGKFKTPLKIKKISEHKLKPNNTLWYAFSYVYLWHWIAFIVLMCRSETTHSFTHSLILSLSFCLFSVNKTADVNLLMTLGCRQRQTPIH